MVLPSFAAPRVGGWRFREKLATEGVEVLNVINAHDVVPIVPGREEEEGEGEKEEEEEENEEEEKGEAVMVMAVFEVVVQWLPPRLPSDVPG